MLYKLRTIVLISLGIALLIAAITTHYSVQRSRKSALFMVEKDAISLANIFIEGARQIHTAQKFDISQWRMRLIQMLSETSPEEVYEKYPHFVKSTAIIDYNGQIKEIRGLTTPEEENFLRELPQLISNSSKEGEIFFFGLDPDFPPATGPYGAVIFKSKQISVLFIPPPITHDVGIGKLARQLAETPSVRYILLQDTAGIIVSSKDIKRMTSIRSDPFLLKVTTEKVSASRRITFQGEKVLELVYPFPKLGEFSGVLRIGLPLSEYREVFSVMKLILGLGIILALLTVITTMMLFTISNRMFQLRQEHDRLLHLRSLGEVAASVAHQIRNPLNAISISLQRLMVEFIPSENPEDFNRIIQVGLSEGKRVDKIVREFIAIAGNISPIRKQVNIKEFMEHFCVWCNDIAIGNEIGFEFENKLASLNSIKIDSEKIWQALENLAKNAFEATFKGGKFNISIEESKNKFIIRLFNTGEHIEKSLIENLFKPYVSTKGKGTGLGLFYSKRVIESHGGTLEANNVHEGVEFVVTLPII